MQYVIKELIAQMVYTLKADSAFDGFTVRRHAGEVNILMFQSPEYWRAMISHVPFVFVKYQGKIGTPMDALKGAWTHEVVFSAYVGTKSLSLESGTESAESAETVLAKIFDLWHGRAFYSQQTWASNIPVLSGTQITTSGFKQLRVLQENGGQDERLMIMLPEITIYETQYNARFLVY